MPELIWESCLAAQLESELWGASLFFAVAEYPHIRDYPIDEAALLREA